MAPMEVVKGSLEREKRIVTDGCKYLLGLCSEAPATIFLS
jgi:hypothetical protein